MAKKTVFLSVGRQGTEAQKEFVLEIRNLLMLSGYVVFTLPSTFENPLERVIEEMAKCDAALIICFERIYAENACQFRSGSDEKNIAPLIIPTIWNHVEAALTKYFRIPTLIIAENGCRPDGMLDPAVQFSVCWTDIDKNSLKSEHFLGMFSGWNSVVKDQKSITRHVDLDILARVSLFEVLKRLRWAHIVWLSGIATAILSFGYWLGSLK